MKRKRKYYMTEHSVERLRERIPLKISQDKIIQALKEKKLCPVKRLTNSRSLYYGKVDGKPLKLIINNNKVVITVLPLFEEDYETDFLYFLNGEYRIKIFPDCYCETNECRMLTIFEKFNSKTGQYEKQRLRKDPFETFFNFAWMIYKKVKFNGETKAIHKERIIFYSS